MRAKRVEQLLGWGTWIPGALLLVVLSAGPARADGDVVVAAGLAGPYRVDVLVSPPQLRSGPSQWSVLVRDPVDGDVVLDSEVEIVLAPQGARDALHHHHHGEEHHRAARSASANRLLHTARLELGAPGTWRARVLVHGEEGAGELAFEISVAPAVSAIVEHWRSFAIPPIGLGLFALHQLRLRRRASPHHERATRSRRTWGRRSTR